MPGSRFTFDSPEFTGSRMKIVTYVEPVSPRDQQRVAAAYAAIADASGGGKWNFLRAMRIAFALLAAFG